MRILVVDDDVQLTRSLVDFLIRQNFIVDVCVDGQTAQEFVQSYTYDLIVLDIMLPKLDGRDLCEKLRQEGVSTPILLLTACDSNRDKVAGLDSGADDYVVKPFDWEELLARIRALLRRASTVSPTIFTWKDLRLDPQSCEVSHSTEKISLRRQEYRLLELFLRHPTQVFSCNNILENLWAFDANPPMEETVRAHIKSLRRKLKAGGAGEVIETVYGLGYRLKAIEPAETGDTATAQSFPQIQAVSDAERLQEFKQDLINLWQELQPEVLEQARILAQTVAHLQAGTSSLSLQEPAIVCAHKLVGIVGTYGFRRSSQRARQIETLLKAGLGNAHSNPQWISALGDQVVALQQELSETLSIPEHPVMQDVDYDYLTRLPHRGRMMQDLDRLLQRATQQQFPVTVCLIAIQNLKSINHQYGYSVGDRVLQDAADQLRQGCNPNDLIVRWSGSKFAIAFYNQLQAQARQTFDTLILQNLGMADPPLLMQLTVGQFPDDGSTVDSLLRVVEL